MNFSQTRPTASGLAFALALASASCQGGGLPKGSPVYSDCPEPIEMTLCDWLSSHPNLVIGRIAAITSVSTPFLYYEYQDSETTLTRTSNDVTICPGSIYDGMAISIDIEDVLTGDLAPGDSIDVHIGYETLSRWSPSPSDPEDDGTLEWPDFAQQDRLVLGQRIGLSASQGITGMYTAGASQLFIETAFGLEFQGIDYCDGSLPPIADTQAIGTGDIRQAAAGCETEPFDEEMRAYLISRFDLTGADLSESVSFTHGGLCSTGVGFPDG